MEDAELSELHRPAAQAIAARPCHVPTAEILVMDYIKAVRRRLDKVTGGNVTGGEVLP